MNIEQLHEIFDKLEDKYNGIEFEGKCFVCKIPVKVTIDLSEKGFVIKGGGIYKIDDDERNNKIILKCDECFAKEPELTDYRDIDVFSRIVGYLQPVNSWNDGKKAEFKLRKTFDKVFENEL